MSWDDELDDWVARGLESSMRAGWPRLDVGDRSHRGGVCQREDRLSSAARGWALVCDGPGANGAWEAAIAAGARVGWPGLVEQVDASELRARTGSSVIVGGAHPTDAAAL